MILEMGMDPEKIISLINNEESENTSNSSNFFSLSEGENGDSKYKSSQDHKSNGKIKDVSSDTESIKSGGTNNTKNDLEEKIGDINTEQGVRNIFKFIQSRKNKEPAIKNTGNKLNLKESKNIQENESSINKDFLNKKRR
jgi:hypothetical protein